MGRYLLTQKSDKRFAELDGKENDGDNKGVPPNKSLRNGVSQSTLIVKPQK